MIILYTNKFKIEYLKIDKNKFQVFDIAFIPKFISLNTWMFIVKYLRICLTCKE